MMGPKIDINIESLINALSNERVVEAFSKLLLPTFTAEVNKQLESFREIIVKRDAEINELKKENAQLRNSTRQQTQQIESLENYTRVDNIIVHGLPESVAAVVGNQGPDQRQPNEDVFTSEKIFTDFCRDKLHIGVNPSDISICHRLPAPRNSDRTTSRPMIVRFSNRKLKAKIIAARKDLKGTNIYVNEHLTKHTSEMFATARRLVKEKRLLGAWTVNGRLVVKVATDQGTDTKTISSPLELSGLSAI